MSNKKEIDIEKAAQDARDKNDSNFKEKLKIKGFDMRESIPGEYYTPDAVLKNKNTYIFCESSSSGDRKTHIGELMQFLTCISEMQANYEFYYILFLCGKSKTKPTPNKESERLKYYFDNYPIKKSLLKRIKGLYVVDQSNIDIAQITIKDFNNAEIYFKFN